MVTTLDLVFVMYVEMITHLWKSSVVVTLDSPINIQVCQQHVSDV